jgi:hypothetical protein
MMIFASPTSIVVSSDAPAGKCAGIKDGGDGGFVGPFGPSISNGAGFVYGAVDDVTTGTADAPR